MAEEADLLILMGSARADGDTAAAVVGLTAAPGLRAEVIPLCSLNIRPFDYGCPAPGDDFDWVIERALAHRRLLLATPVYWYAMSGLMKTFFDRLSDLLSDRDPARRGRALPGREIWGLAVGTEPTLPAGFEVPFEATVRYLGMDWRGFSYIRSGSRAVTEECSRQLAALAADLSTQAGAAGARSQRPVRSC